MAAQYASRNEAGEEDKSAFQFQLDQLDGVPTLAGASSSELIATHGSTNTITGRTSRPQHTAGESSRLTGQSYGRPLPYHVSERPPLPDLARLSFEPATRQQQDPHPTTMLTPPKGMNPGAANNSPSPLKPAPVTKSDRLLRESYQKRKYPRKYFVQGRVFQALWTEESEKPQNMSDVGSGAWSRNSYGQDVYTTPRRFVVVKEGEWSCTVLPVTTYGTQGMKKSGVRIPDHGIIYTGKTVPVATDVSPNGPQMQRHAVRVEPDDKTEKLDPLSRIDYSKQHTIDHKRRIRPIGMVNASLEHLLAQYEQVTFGNDGRGRRRIDSVLSARGPASPVDFVGDNSVNFLAHKAVRDLMSIGWPCADATLAVGLAPANMSGTSPVGSQ
ncbi:hypothetical protein LTR56_011211 [Elasticomyces elasticus]|nr:hypothetical protein LTR56_011211 [Elasticomyces elasticus]KAK3650425.1 hypothetical protein LTR22_012515 [Elasticomyces elasticus]KAK4921842.1 hypothetical protein LTR49_010781 [Elasticomyces elasticus]KAK5751432.1 hypothetical protein LTS12_018520 [Elasticomyces elasticus]